MRDELETSAFDRAEGLRYLGRLLRAGLTSFSENTGPEYPCFRAMPELVKMGLDNPDNYYLSAGVNPRYRYRIRGNRGSIHYMSFAAQNQNFAAREKITGGAGHLNDAELEIDSDGNFEIIASQKEEPGNWLRMVPETTQLIIRQTYLDRETESPADLRIERIGGESVPSPLTAELVDKGLASAAGLVVGCSNLFAGWAKGFEKHVNELPQFDDSVSMGAGGDPNAGGCLSTGMRALLAIPALMDREPGVISALDLPLIPGRHNMR